MEDYNGQDDLEFCARSYWGPYHEGKMTDCFEVTVFSCIIPVAFLIIFGTMSLWRILREESGNGASRGGYEQLQPVNGTGSDGDQIVENRGGEFQCKFWFSILLAVLYVAELCVLLDQGRPYKLFSSLVDLLAVIFVILLVRVEFQKAPIGVGSCTWSVTLFYFALLAGNVPHTMSMLRDRPEGVILHVQLTKMACMVVVGLISLKSSIFQRSVVVYGQSEMRETQASWVSRLGFVWFDFLAAKGYRNPLELEDLWHIPELDKTTYITNLFSAKRQARRARGKTGLFGDIMSLVAYEGFVQAIWMFWASVLVFTGPFFLNKIVDFLEHEHDPKRTDMPPVWLAYCYAIGIFVGPCLKGIADGQNYFMGRRIGMHIRSALVGAVYRKALRFKASVDSASVGEITNLMAVDANRILEVSAYIHQIWSCPLQIFVAVILLYGVLGWSSMAGVLLMVLMLPLDGWVANKIGHYQDMLMETTDNRISVMNEILQGIRIIKFFAWEKDFLRKISEARAKEIKNLARYIYFLAATNTIWFATPVLVSLSTFVCYSKVAGNDLHATEAFTAMALFNVLKSPLGAMPDMINRVMEAKVSVDRIDEFLDDEEIDSKQRTNVGSNSFIKMKNSDFSWGNFALRDISLHCESGKLTTIVGATGSGKSSLALAMLGEVTQLKGESVTNGSIAYVSQQAWIQNATVRDNILFGKPYDEAWYKKTVIACSLVRDFELLEAGDMTEIGEKGLNLSGGQKQRLSLARAVYQNADIIIMDDPLSAVDAHVGKDLFEKCVCGILKKKTRVLVSHQVGLVVPRSDHIVVMKGGRIAEQGTKKYLLKEGKVLPEIMNDAGNANSGDEDLIHDEKNEQVLMEKLEAVMAKYKTGNTLVDAESRSTGTVDTKVYSTYFNAVGGVTFMFMFFVSFAVSQAFTMWNDYWLKVWATEYTVKEPEDVDIDYYLQMYAFISFLNVAAILGKSILQSWGSLRASKFIHDRLIFCILRAPVRFFDVTPLGRIMNRFSKDLQSIDQDLNMSSSGFVLQVLQTLAVIVMVCYATPSFIIALVPIWLAYSSISRYYMKTSTELKRLDAVTRSPIYAQFSETLNGAATVRAYDGQRRFESINDHRVDVNHRAFFLLWTSNRWLTLRLEILGAFVVFGAAVSALLGRQTVDPSLAGLSLSYALNFTESVMWVVRMHAMMEMDMNSVERAEEFMRIPQEAPAIIEYNRPPSSWPSKGRIDIKNLVLAYAPELPPVIKGISLEIGAQEKIGIVGRTGAGKSTITLCLFRFMEPLSGTVRIDGIDVTTVGLEDLRSRISIIPQDPVLFSGTIRSNLDPFNQASDHDVWRALKRAHVSDYVESQPEKLMSKVTENGENLSVGQRQLMCLARAILRKSAILVMDEATASVDVTTDTLIQETIKTEFKNSTVLTIAHRLKTIIDYDKVLVLDSGKVKEFDSPSNLLAIEGGHFRSMCDDSGEYETLMEKAAATRRLKNLNNSVNVDSYLSASHASYESRRGSANPMLSCSFGSYSHR
eukprot:Nk52_evm15s1524 gene=Nk52_evmTU15s1524